MNITLQELKKDVYNMMFLEPNEYEEYDRLFPSALNYSLIDIAKNFGKLEIYQLTQQPPADDEEGYNEYDMLVLTNDETQGRMFLDFALPPIVKVVNDGLEIINDYVISQRRYLKLNRQNAGVFNINYRKYPIKITDETPDNTLIDLEPELLNIAKLCTVWQLYYDDDRGLATQKFNEYSNAKEQLIKREAFNKGITINKGIKV